MSIHRFLSRTIALAVLLAGVARGQEATPLDGRVAVVADFDGDGLRMAWRVGELLARDSASRRVMMSQHAVDRVMEAMTPDDRPLSIDQAQEMGKALRARLLIALVRDSVDQRTVHLMIVAAGDEPRELGKWAMGGIETASVAMSRAVLADPAFQRVRMMSAETDPW